MVVELETLLCGVENFNSGPTGGDITHWAYMVRHLRGSFLVSPLLFLEVATPERKKKTSEAVVRDAKKYAQGAEVRLTSGSK